MLKLIVYSLAITTVAFTRSARQRRVINGAFVGNVVMQEGVVKSVENRGEYPYMVAIEYKTPSQVCGGVLIAADKVLTAAHCLKNANANNLQVRAGHLIKTDTQGSAQVQAVSKFELHPQFNKTRPNDYMARYLNNDIAFIKLQRPFTLTRFVQPINLPEIGQDFTNQTATALGWGKTETNFQSPYLKKVELKVLSRDECKTSYIHDGDLSKICLISEKEPKGVTCSGDSGGPLAIHNQNPANDILIGINSHGAKPLDYCESEIFANVPYLMPWVNYQISAS